MMSQKALPAPVGPSSAVVAAVPTSAPGTPQGQRSQSGTSSRASTPGTWTHPRMAEITQRQAAQTFTDENVQVVLTNAVVLLCTFLIAHAIQPIMPAFLRDVLDDSLKRFHPYDTYAMWLLRLVLLYNVGVALSPLFLPKDDMSDIPLTPTQRKLLGLPPASAPPPLGSQYITPPRYQRSTPRSSERATAGSPLSGRSSPGMASQSGSPYSPAPSPLLQKAVNGSTTRRLSYGSPSPLSSNMLPSDSNLDSIKLPSTPTPGSGSRRSSVGLNNKWLYDRGKSSSRSSLYT